MIVQHVRETRDQWEIHGPLGECLQLPKKTAIQTATIATIGTRRLGNIAGSVTRRFAERLASLERDIFLIDIRRSGCGGQGSWGPLEFSTVIPSLLSLMTSNSYSYFHLPVASPSLDLLARWRAATKMPEVLDKSEIDEVVGALALGDANVGDVAYKHWQVFRAAYISELTPTALLAGQAFVEASSRSGVPVFLCAEPYCPEFLDMTQEDQDLQYCHRFTFVNAIARQIRSRDSDVEIQPLHISLD